LPNDESTKTREQQEESDRISSEKSSINKTRRKSHRDPQNCQDNRKAEPERSDKGKRSKIKTNASGGKALPGEKERKTYSALNETKDRSDQTTFREENSRNNKMQGAEASVSKDNKNP